MAFFNWLNFTENVQIKIDFYILHKYNFVLYNYVVNILQILLTISSQTYC